MKLPYKIALVIIGIVVLVTLLSGIGEQQSAQSYAIAYGFFALIGGAATLIAAILITVLQKSNKDWILGLFLAAGILLLTCFFGLSQISFSR